LLQADTTTSAVANYTNIRIVDEATNNTVMGPKELVATAAASDSTQTLTFQDSFNLTAGKTRNFKIMADVANNTATNFANDSIKATLNAFGSDYLKNTESNLYVTPSTDVVPNTALGGNTMNMSATSLTVSLSSTPISTTYVKGSTANLLGVALQAGDASDVKVTSITLAGYLNPDGVGFVAGSKVNPTDEAA
jgi:hypothetical protein